MTEGLRGVLEGLLRGEWMDGSEVYGDSECISNPSVSLISLSGDITTITTEKPVGPAETGLTRTYPESVTIWFNI